MAEADRLCEEIARTDHGIVSFDEATKAGHSDSDIRYRLRHLGWEEVHPGVYRLPGAPETAESCKAAAVKAGGPGAMLSHRSAGVLHGLEGITEGRRIEIVAYTGIKLQGVKVHRLKPDDRPGQTFVNGLPVTRVERTIIDLAGCLPIRVVGVAIDHALRKRVTTLARLWRELDTTGGQGRRGTRALRIMLEVRDEMTAEMRSTFEAKMRRILKRIKDHSAIPNFRVVTPHGVRYFDFCYPGLKLAIECHSVDYHTGERMKADVRRHRELEAMGYKILYFLWDEVCFQPEMVEAEVRRAIAEREVLLKA
jgi:very-short-patch-repair endonuclease